jgi:hypothetical protein
MAGSCSLADSNLARVYIQRPPESLPRAEPQSTSKFHPQLGRTSDRGPLQAIEGDDDMLAAMARELVENKGSGNLPIQSGEASSSYGRPRFQPQETEL